MRKRFSRLSCTVTGLVVLILVMNVSGWMVNVPLSDLVKECDHIVIGKVTGVRSSWNADSTLIHTDVTISVERQIKGPSPRKMMVVSLVGGIVGDIGLWQSDTPSFKPDEKVLLFLRQRGGNAFEVVGSYQGKLTINGQDIVGRRITVDAFVQKIHQIMTQ